MTKQSSIAVKLPTLAFIIRVFAVLVVAAPIACINPRTVRIPAEYNGTESIIAIAPVENIGELYISPSGAGMVFGVAGVLIEDLTTASKRATLAKAIKEGWGDWRPETVLSRKLTEELIKRGRKVIQGDEITPLPEKIRAQLGPKSGNQKAVDLWYSPDVTVFDHSRIITRCNPTVIMEAGYGDITAGGAFANFLIVIKVVNPFTNFTIARRLKVARLNSTKASPTVDSFKSDFESSVGKAVPEMLDDLGF
jgi:hypothetical protein